MHEIKVKNTRSKPHEATISHYDLPKEIVEKYKDPAIVTDMFFANRMYMIISRSYKIKFLKESFMETE